MLFSGTQVNTWGFLPMMFSMSLEWANIRERMKSLATWCWDTVWEFLNFQDKFQKEVRLKLACCMKQSRSQPIILIVACGKAGQIIYYMFYIQARRLFKWSNPNTFTLIQLLFVLPNFRFSFLLCNNTHNTHTIDNTQATAKYQPLHLYTSIAFINNKIHIKHMFDLQTALWINQ